MELQTFILEYGYLVVLVWAFLEGESVLLAAGFLAQQGLLDPVVVALLAALGGFCADQAIFHAGRLYGPRLLARWPRLGEHAERVLAIARRHQDLLILSCRFLYGLRTVTPVTLGADSNEIWLDVRVEVSTPEGRQPVGHSGALDAVGSLAWGATYTAIGWGAGAAVQRWLGDLEGRGWLLAALVAGLVVSLWLAHRLFERVRPRR